MMSSSCDTFSLTVLPLEVNHANSVWISTTEADKNAPDKQAGRQTDKKQTMRRSVRQFSPFVVEGNWCYCFSNLMTDFFCAACCSLFDLFLMNFNWSFSETDPSLGSIRQHKQRQQRPHRKPIKNATKIKTNAESERRMSTPSPYLLPFHSYVYYAS